ncbi:IS4 family transposase, partial [Geobacillus stearothermophilus]
MNKHTTLPNLMQKLVSDEEIQLIAEAVGYRDSSRTFTLRELIHFFLLAAMH